MYAKITSGQPTKYPYTIGDLRKDNPNVSFPKILSAEQLVSWGVVPVSVQATPSFDPATQRVDTASLPTLIGDQWTIVKTVVDKTSEQIAADNANRAATLRQKRDDALRDSDWTQVADAPVDKAAWATYRQSLRDLPSADAWPYVDLPQKPN